MKKIITLIGPKKSGKTTTLIELARILSLENKNKAEIKAIEESFSKWNKQQSKDLAIIIVYNGKTIFIATRGDGEEEINDNIRFFKSDEECWQPVKILEENHIKQLRKFRLPGFTPDICIIACRNEKNLTKIIDSFAKSVAVKPTSFDKKDIHEDYRIIANNIKSEIDK